MPRLNEFDPIGSPPQGTRECIDAAAGGAENPVHSPTLQPFDDQVRYQLPGRAAPFVFSPCRAWWCIVTALRDALLPVGAPQMFALLDVAGVLGRVLVDDPGVAGR